MYTLWFVFLLLILCVLFLDPPRPNLRPRPGGKPRPTGPKPKPKPKPSGDDGGKGGGEPSGSQQGNSANVPSWHICHVTFDVIVSY